VDATPYPRGTAVTYHGSIEGHHGERLIVLGPCPCDRHPCPEGCDQQLPHYALADPWDDPHADPLTLEPAMLHVRHTSITLYEAAP
jgi:hypothetical protein